MSGVHQIKEQNERILTLLGERRPVEEESSGDSATAAVDTQAGEEEDNARSH